MQAARGAVPRIVAAARRRPGASPPLERAPPLPSGGVRPSLAVSARDAVTAVSASGTEAAAAVHAAAQRAASTASAFVVAGTTAGAATAAHTAEAARRVIAAPADAAARRVKRLVAAVVAVGLAGAFLYGVGNALPHAAVRYALEQSRSVGPARVVAPAPQTGADAAE